MAKVSSGLSLSTNYFMRNYYANNRDVIKTVVAMTIQKSNYHLKTVAH